MIWEYLWAWTAITKWLYHLNWGATDSSWNWNNWTPTDISWVLGKIWSWCASFNGSTSIISITDSSTLSPSWSFTLNAWIKVNSYNNTATLWLWKWWETNNAREYALAEWDATNLQFYIASTWAYWAWSFLVSTSKPSTWVWTLFTCVFTSWVWWTIYKNWISSGSNTSTMTSVQDNANPFQMGYATNNFWGVSNKFNWYIDEVIFENYAWTATQIKKYYTYALWRFAII